MNVFKEVESRFETRGDEIVAIVGQMAHEELEGGASGKTILGIARRNREFIVVGEETGEESTWEDVPPRFMPVSGHKLL